MAITPRDCRATMVRGRERTTLVLARHVVADGFVGTAFPARTRECSDLMLLSGQVSSRGADELAEELPAEKPVVLQIAGWVPRKRAVAARLGTFVRGHCA